MNKPKLGAPCFIDRETRLSLVVDRDRELFQVEVQTGGTWHLHSAPSESFLTAIEVARRVAHRARSERPELPMQARDFDWPGPEPWAEARYPTVDHYGQYNMATLGGRIRRARARVGMRT